MYYGTQTIAALIVAAVLAFVIPIGAVTIYKLKNRDAWLPSAFIGAAAFFLFAMILEQLLHAVMLPIVQNSTVLYIIYGALAAGIFEETGRFVAYKTLMKNKYSTKNAIMMGLGHGGIEVMLVLGITMINYLIYMIMVNSQGMESVSAVIAAGNPNAVEAALAQLEALKDYGFGNVALSVFERLLAMTIHVSLSVVVYLAAARPGKIYLFPAAIVLHALFDTPAAMSQVGIITSAPLLYTIFTVMTVGFAVFAVMLAKKLPDKTE